MDPMFGWAAARPARWRPQDAWWGWGSRFEPRRGPGARLGASVRRTRRVATASRPVSFAAPPRRRPGPARRRGDGSARSDGARPRRRERRLHRRWRDGSRGFGVRTGSGARVPTI